MISDKQIQIEAAKFAKEWQGSGYEKGQTQPFWMSLLRVFGIESPEKFIQFEVPVKSNNTSFIDAFIPSTLVLIEQKSSSVNLRRAIRQSDGTQLTPFEQAKRYNANRPYTLQARWIVVCNFTEFMVYDMEHPGDAPQSILLENLEKEYYRLKFLVDNHSDHLAKELQVSVEAGGIIGGIYEALLQQYGETDEETLRMLNVLCVRLVFCLYAEDATIFSRDQFYQYLHLFDAKSTRMALRELFVTLNTPIEKRSPYLRKELKDFPYVNGGLFAEKIDVPQFTPELQELLLHKASLDFDWSAISPTIFGAVFESTLNPETRRSGGMHYTSVENIHKVIDPLFLNDLRSEFRALKSNIVSSREKKRLEELRKFQEKLASLKFFDPACGSGNFLTETYLSLRRLENEVIEEMTHGQTLIGFDETDIVKVSINQFYGIEINDFATTVAATALWISEAQMLIETERIIKRDMDFLPLKHYANITEGNALSLDWNDIVSANELTYIIGNPPFVGARLMDKSQKDDMLRVFGVKWQNVGNLDYVCCWYKKALDYIKGTSIAVALVSTNSITQGEQVEPLWAPLFDDGLSIKFAYRTFRWDSEARSNAHVHCVIVGFVDGNATSVDNRYLFDGDEMLHAENINAYLLDAPSVFIKSRNTPISDVPEMQFGSMPNDRGLLSNFSDEEMKFLVKKYPVASILFKKIVGAEEFINNRSRWCLWLKDISPSVYKGMTEIYRAVAGVREMRQNSTRPGTRKLADVPMLFGEIRQPDSDFLIVPRVSSERREYVPMGYANSDIIASDAVQIIPSATLYHFGVLESSVHMAWMRSVCGRLETRYRYSKQIVYNNFPWPEVSEKQRDNIAKTAQQILNARAKYSDSSLADLYDPDTMPIELRKAHAENDRAVLRAFCFDVNMTEPQIVAQLFKRYKKLIKK
jgi:type I restriction-modification system DNA methylase subunit